MFGVVEGVAPGRLATQPSCGRYVTWDGKWEAVGRSFTCFFLSLSLRSCSDNDENVLCAAYDFMANGQGLARSLEGLKVAHHRVLR